MKLIPHYSYEYNQVLNSSFDENDNIKNFASLLSDKDRFLPLLSLIEEKTSDIEKCMGFEFPSEVEFYVVRAEMFKSFSKPVTIEYSLLVEEMLVYLFKEIVKISVKTRFPDAQTQESYINSFVDYCLINIGFGDLDLVKFGRNLHEYSQKLYKDYTFEDRDFSEKSLKVQIEELYENNN